MVRNHGYALINGISDDEMTIVGDLGFDLGDPTHHAMGIYPAWYTIYVGG